MTFLLALSFVLMDVLNLEKTDSVNSTKWLFDYCVTNAIHWNNNEVQRVSNYPQLEYMLIDHITYILYIYIGIKEIDWLYWIMKKSLDYIFFQKYKSMLFFPWFSDKLRTKSVAQQFCLYFSLDMFLFLCIWNVYDITYSSLCALSPKHSGKLYDNQITSVDT